VTVQEAIALLQNLPQNANLKIREDGGAYDWIPTRIYSNGDSVYITNKAKRVIRNEIRY
jgi:type IV secretory pathway VirB9-like protein